MSMNCGNQMALGDYEELNMRAVISNYSTMSTTSVLCAGGKDGYLVVILLNVDGGLIAL